MKPKELKDLKGHFSSKLLLAVALIVAFVCGIPLGAYAENDTDSIINENYNLITQYSLRLDEDISSYSSMDDSPDRSISKSVAFVINDYQSKLRALQSHSDVGKRSLSAEINLAFARGKAAGKLAWIYHYNISDISDKDSTELLKELYAYYIKSIDDSVDAAVLNATSDVICNDMNRAVFKEKIANLSTSGDSPAVESLILGHIEDLEYINSTDVWGENFKAKYDIVKKEVILQRFRDNLIGQMEKILQIVLPGESYTDNEITLIYGFMLKNAQTVSDMNIATQDTIYELTQVSEKEHYSYIFISNLSSEIAEVTVKANKNGKTGDFLSLFKDYTLERKKAYAKDRIAEIIFKGADKNDAELKGIEALFNGEGGLVEACKDQSSLEGELDRAGYRKSLWNALADSRKKLSIVIGSHDGSSFKERMEAAHAKSAAEIDKLSTGASDFELRCEDILKSGAEALRSILNEGKAERFLQDHKAIIKKPREELTASDEAHLKAALSDYIYLETDVKGILTSQINSIAEKYKSVLCEKIRGLCADDAYYQELCEAICQEVNELSVENIDVFYNNSELIFKKSQALQAIFLYYREIGTMEEYKSFSEEEKNALADACRQASEELKGVDLTNPDALDAAIASIVDSARLSLDRTAQYARVRISAGDSENAEIQKVLADVKAKISASVSKSEMIAFADGAIFKINRYLTIDEINLRADANITAINAMEFLTDDEKAVFVKNTESIKSALAYEAGLAENVTVLSFVWNKFLENSAEVFNGANDIDCQRGIEHYSELIDKSLEAMKIELRGMAHLSSDRIGEFYASMEAICEKFKGDITACKSCAEIKTTHEGVIEQLNAVQLAAASENLENYKKVINTELEALKNVKDKYSDTNYQKLVAIIDKAKEKLKSRPSIAECSALLEATKEEIAEVNDLLDDAIDKVISTLDTLLADCKSEPLLYSAENIGKIADICKNTANAVREFTEIADIPKVNETLEKGLELIKRIPKDRTFTSKDAFVIDASGARYPEGYDISKGLWASISCPGAIVSDAMFSVRSTAFNKDVQNLIRNAAKKKTLTVYGTPSEEQLKMLKKCEISMAVDIRLSSLSPDATAYTVKILLPDSLAGENVLGLVFTDENGSVDFYNAQRNGSVITVTLPYLAECYIVSENTVDLAPLIIFLTILLVFEVVALCFFIFLRRNRRRKENNMLPDSFLHSINPFLIYSALRVKPENGVGITLILAVSALALGCAVATLAKAEFKAFKKERKTSQSAPKRPDEQKRLAKKRETLLLKEKTYLLEEKKRQPVYCQNTSHNAFIQREDIPHQSEYDSLALHRAEVNLDVIADKFSSGELVTPEALKRKRLIPRKTDYVKILARGKLTKPLLIEAHDFSRAAEEMLKAVGGEAIRIKY